jgi:HK97 gp10 family phage protein
MPYSISVKLEGLEGVLKRLGRLKKQTTRSKILRKAINAAARPVLKAARGLVPVQSGLLKKSLGMKVKTYRKSGTVIAIIGPRTGFKREVTVGGQKQLRNPTKYAHLVELGRQAVRVKKKKVLAGSGRFFGKSVQAARPQSFLRAAWQAQKSAAENTIRRLVQEGIAAEFKKGKA